MTTATTPIPPKETPAEASEPLAPVLDAGSRWASFSVENDGEVVVNYGWVEAAGERVAALAFDMKTKRPEVIATSCGGDNPCAPGVILSGQHALYINEAKRGEPTHIIFPEYSGWRVHCAEVARYTLKICLIAPNAASEPHRGDNQ